MEFRELFDSLQTRVRLNPEEEALSRQRKLNREAIDRANETIERLTARIEEIETQARERLRDWSAGIEKELVDRLVRASSQAAVRLQEEARRQLEDTAKSIQDRMKQQSDEFLAGIAMRVRQITQALDEAREAEMESFRQLARNTEATLGGIGKKFETVLKTMPNPDDFAMAVPPSPAPAAQPETATKSWDDVGSEAQNALESAFAEAPAETAETVEIKDDPASESVDFDDMEEDDIRSDSSAALEAAQEEEDEPDAAEAAMLSEAESLLNELESMGEESSEEEAAVSTPEASEAPKNEMDELDALLAEVEGIVPAEEVDKQATSAAPPAAESEAEEKPAAVTPPKKSPLPPKARGKKKERDWTDDVMDEMFGHEKELGPDDLED